MRLFIAEKPSVARSLATVLGANARGDGCLYGNGVTVTWCFGHLFEPAFPDHYDPAYKDWRMEHLPIAPREWQVLPKDGTKKQLKIIGGLLKDARDVVNAGDPDNEGQLLVDEVLEHFKCRKPVLRFWASAQDDASIRDALATMRANGEYAGFRDAARARQRADWLIGMNFSRAFTLQHRARGGAGVISVGRVQTPTLAMVAARDLAIAEFKAVPFYVVLAQVRHPGGSFRTRWKPAKNQAGLDGEGRLLDVQIAESLIAKIEGQEGRVVEFARERKIEQAPKGYSLTGLTLQASKAFGYGASEVLEGCQALYEQHKLASYPRTDCEFMPESQHAAAPGILAALRSNLPDVAGWIDGADPTRKSRLWDDSKVTAHHAIVPTGHRSDLHGLSERERNLYLLIVRNYLAQFYPAHEFDQTTVLVEAVGESFTASGRTERIAGWRELFGAADEAEPRDDQDELQVLPAMREGDAVQIESASRPERRTKPPVRFTEATLIVAMENIYKYIEDVEDKKSLREGDGIGTPATRAAIVSELKRRGFLAAEKKYIVSTPEGREALDALPPLVKSASLTAQFQRQLREIERGALALDRFVADQVGFVSQQLGRVVAETPAPVVYSCPACGSGRMRRVQRRDKSGFFWSCSEFRSGCLATANDEGGKPLLPAKPAAATSA